MIRAGGATSEVVEPLAEWERELLAGTEAVVAEVPAAEVATPPTDK
jgi:hypothetical protein